MYSKIIVALDDSLEARVVLPMASALARALDNEIVLTSVIPEVYATKGVTDLHGAALREESQSRRSLAETNLARARETLSASGARVDMAFHLRRSAADVLEMANIVGAGVIAIAARQALPPGSFLGGIGDEIARTTSRAVLLTRVHEPLTFESISDVIVPLDDFAQQTLSVASEIAKATHARLMLIHTLPSELWNTLDGPHRGDLPTRVFVHIEDKARSYLEAEALELRKQGLTVCTRLALFGGVYWEVERAAKAARMPLVILSNRRHSFGSRMLSRIAHRIFRNFTAPTLLVGS